MDDRRGRHWIPASARLFLGAAMLAVAACGTTSPSPASTVAAPATPTVAPASAIPEPTASPGPVATPGSSQAAGAPACSAADLKASHGFVEGAAGSRLTEVLLVSAVACSVEAFPVLGLRDANGAALVGAVSAGPGRIDLVPGTPYASAVRLANWCAPEPAFPLTLQIRLGAEELAVEGSSFPAEGDLPSCTGEGQAPILEGGAWTAHQP